MFGVSARPLAVWIGVSAVLGALPLVGAPGYESALVFGIVSSLWVPVATRFEPSLRQGALSAALAGGGRFGALHALASLGVLCVRALFTGFCDGLEGIAFFIVSAGFGMVLSGALGGAARAAARRHRVLGGLDWCVPVGLFALFGLEFYFTPAVFGFSPFVGVFLGPLYDTIYFPWERILSYRLGSVATLGAAFCLARARDAGLRGEAATTRRLGRLGLVCVAAALVISGGGARLGHRTTTDSLRRALGATIDGTRCTVHFDERGIGVERARLLADECAAHVAELEEDLGVRQPERRFVVFLFSTDDRKAELFGARSTNIAKPWRGEVYVRNEPFPHPVLRHELAHAVGAALGRGPFAIAGRFGGILPDPGRVEGLAVYAAGVRGPDAQDLLGWARAQRDAGQLPALGAVFGLGFYRSAAPNAYTAAGAFFAFVARRFGAGAVADFYRNADGERWFGRTLPELERDFQAELDAVSSDPRLRRYAEQKFASKAIFARRCPQRVGRLVDELATGCEGSPEAIEGPLSELRRLDADDYDVRLLALGCGIGVGAEGLVRGLAAEIERTRDDLAPWQRATLLEVEALRAAPAVRERLLGAAMEEARNPRALRHLALLRWANGVDDEVWRLFVELLRGNRERAFFAAATRFEASEVPAPFRYLRGKAALVAGAEPEAFADLSLALGHLPTAELEEEARRSLMLASCRSAELRGRARAHLEGTSVDPGERARLDALLRYCERGFGGR